MVLPGGLTIDENGELVHLDKGLSARPQRARYTEERIDDILETYGSDSETYAQAYITSMSPRTFLKLTLSDEKRSEWERAEKEGTRTDEIFPLDTEQLKSESQTPFLKIDSESGEVLSHEGRHRMLAMYNAGIRNVPVVVIDNKIYDVLMIDDPMNLHKHLEIMLKYNEVIQ